MRSIVSRQDAWTDPLVKIHPSASIDIEASVNLPHIDARAVDRVILTIGGDAYIGPHVRIDPSGGNGISIGDHTSINSFCDVLGEVEIGRYCTLASHIYMSSGRHYFDLEPHLPIHEQDQIAMERKEIACEHNRKVTIDEDVWIGRGVYIGAGIRIGRGAVVGANSVVIKDLAPYGVYAGVPARKLRDRSFFSPESKIYANRQEDLPYFYKGFDCSRVAIKNAISHGHLVFSGSSVVALKKTPFNRLILLGTNLGEDCTISAFNRANLHELGREKIKTGEFQLSFDFPRISKEQAALGCVSNSIFQAWQFIEFNATSYNGSAVSIGLTSVEIQ